MYGIKWDKANSVVDSNLYWHAGEDVDFNGLGLKEWQSETGKDLHSVIADPGIRTGDYHPTNRKALRKIGFEQFDWSEVGVYGDAGWLDLARYSSDRAALYDSTVERYLRQ